MIPSGTELRAGRVRLTAGVRESEAELVATLRALQAGGADAVPRLVSAPVRVIVSSHALREALSARLVEQLGPALLGVVVQTLPRLAETLLHRAGQPWQADPGLFPALIERALAAEPELVATLGSLERGHALVAATASDLLSAGLTPALLQALPGALAGASDDALRRSLALARVATRVESELAAHGLARRESAIAQATAALEREGPRLLGARAVLVFGFADATGLRAGLLRALLACGAQLWLELPNDRLQRGQRAAGCRFAERFAARLGLPRRAIATSSTPAAPATLDFVAASGVEAEVTEVAFRLQQTLREGAIAERVGVVLYDGERYLLPLRRALERRGVPYRALQPPAAADPQHRRWRAIFRLLRRGAATSIDGWIDALAPEGAQAPPAAPRAADPPAAGDPLALGHPLELPSSTAREDLRLGLRLLGALRVLDVARLDVARVLGQQSDLPLPVRAGLQCSTGGQADDPDEGGGARWRAARKRLEGARLRWAVDAARSLEAAFAGWSTAPLAQHVARTRALLARELGWAVDAGLAARLDALVRGLPGTLELERGPFLTALEGELLSELTPLATSGGGVWVLDVTRARSLTFDALWLLGLNRGVLPRAGADDPLLGDELRRRLQAVLPELALKRAAQDEQRYLFAQLLTAAPRVTLSWQQLDDDGVEQAPSPLVQRLLLGGQGVDSARPALVPGGLTRRLHPPHAGGLLRPRSADELARLGALSKGRADLGPALARRWLEAQATIAGTRALGLDLAAAQRVAEAQVTLLAARDSRWSAAGTTGARIAPGPYAGAIGALRLGVPDPRRGALSVTTLEDYARCPWRALLRRVLRVEAAPDPQAQLPALSAPIIGMALHRALERLVGGGSGRDRSGAAEDPAHAVRCPSPGARRAAVDEAAAEIAHEAGLGLLPGLQRALALTVQPLVERAVALDWATPTASVEVVGTERAGEVALLDDHDRPRRVTFRADRVDRLGPALLLTDFKTGRPFATVKGAETRLAHLRKAVRQGERLQAAVYAASSADPPAIGRYVFLAEGNRADAGAEDPAEAASSAAPAVDFTLAGDDAAVTHDLPQVARLLFAAWDAGCFFPRLELPRAQAQRLCDHCELRVACVQGDSGARLEQRRWFAALRDARAGALPGTALAEGAGAIGLALWELPAAGAAKDAAP